MYDLNDPQFLDASRVEIRDNEKAIKRAWSQDIDLIERLFNAQYEIASHHFWTLRNPHVIAFSDKMPILFSAFHKNLITLYSIYDLTKRGLFGSARTLMRYVFESLMIAKFCSLSSSDRVFVQWEQGEEIYFTNAVIKKIDKPNTQPFIHFWKALNQQSHPSIYSQQISLGWKENGDEIEQNLVLIQVLQECNYHLLNSHIISSSMRYWEERLGGRERVRELKETIRELLTRAKKDMVISSRRLIWSYTRSWKLRL